MCTRDESRVERALPRMLRERAAERVFHQRARASKVEDRCSISLPRLPVEQFPSLFAQKPLTRAVPIPVSLRTRF